MPANNDDALSIWLNNFSAKLRNTYASRFGISNAEADAMVDLAKFFAFLVAYLESVRSFSEGLTAYKKGFKKAALNTALPAVPQFSYTMPATIPSTSGMMITVRKMVSRIKAHADYHPNDGEDLGIEGATQSFDADKYKPKGKAKSLAGSVHVRFAKKGAEAMNVYAHDADTNKLTLLATQSQSPFVDARPLLVAGKAENRRYVLRGVIADKEIGKLGDTIVIAFGG